MILRLLKFWFTRQQQPRTLYLIRGIAGSGKTTLAESLTPWHCAADMMPGLYKDGSYNRELQFQSHRWCKDTIEQWLRQGRRKVAVHNTFVLYQWIEPYEKLAHQYGYRFQVIHCEGEHGSVHNVPEELMQRWRETWERYR
jgi:predicted kinase